MATTRNTSKEGEGFPPDDRPLNTADLLARKWQRLLYRPLQPLVERLFGFHHARDLYREAQGDRLAAGPFVRKILSLLQVEWSLPAGDLAKLRSLDGPLVFAANHPYGGLDSLILIDLLDQLCPGGWKILSNHILHGIRPLTPHLVPVDALGLGGNGRRLNARAMKTALRHLREDGCLALFPARRVAHREASLGVVVDQPWSEHAVKLAAKSRAHLVGLHVPGHNSERFLKVPLRFPRLRGLMLSRELTGTPPRQLEVRLAAHFDPRAVARLTRDSRASEKLRARVHLEDDLRTPPPGGGSPSPGSPKSVGTPTGKVPALPPESFRLFEKDPFDVFLFRGDEAPKSLEALGRAREVTFRAAGQGVGTDIDLTPEDPYYHQLVVWDREALQIAGAYRIGLVPDILNEYGPKGLYLDHVFKIDPSFYDHFPRSMELSRSFVLPRYQKDNRVLPLLWRGLAVAARRHSIRTLFGSVTISDDFHPASRAILVEFLKSKHAESPEIRGLVEARAPFVPQTRYHSLIARAYRDDSLNALDPLIREIEQDQRGIPPLMRYYGQLGAKFLSYHVEAAFGNALYCLLQVDLEEMPAAYKRRFFPDD